MEGKQSKGNIEYNVQVYAYAELQLWKRVCKIVEQ